MILHVPSEIDDLFETVFTLLKETPPNYLQELSVLSWRILLELSGTSAGQNYPEELVNQYKDSFISYYEQYAAYYGSTLEEFLTALTDEIKNKK